ncbi:MAG: hypothetical protein WDA17_00380 [Sphaerochaetaceae bacterium]
MNSSTFWRALTNNWTVKVFSLLLAIGIFFVVNYATVDQKVIEIPLQIVMPQDYEAISTVPPNVNLIIRSDPRYTRLVDPYDFKAKVDFSFVQSDGVSSSPVLLTSDSNYKSMNLFFTTDPEIIRIYFVAKEQESTND